MAVKPGYTSTKQRIPPEYVATQVAPTYPGSTNFSTLATTQPTKFLSNGTRSLANSTRQTEVDSDGNTWEYIDYGDGTGEWKKTKDAAGTLVGDAAESAARGSPGGSISGNGQGAIPYDPNPAKQITAQKQEDDYIKQILDNAKANQAENRSFIDNNVMPAYQGQVAAAGNAGMMDLSMLQQQQAAAQKATAARAALSAEQRGLASDYNNQTAQAFGAYQNQQTGLNTQDQANLSRYMGETDPLMQQLRAQGSDPADVARQLSSYSALQGIGNGSLDYTADQAALNQYYSNPEDQQRQEDAYQKFQSIGAGGLDYESKAAQAYANPEDVQNQKQALSDIRSDLTGGDKDQREIFDLMKSRTGDQATAEEAYLAEMARRKFESDDRSSRAAVMNDLGQRGIRSGAAEIANQLAAREQAGQDRTLAQLGMQAQAIGRAKDYTTLAGQQANAMRGNTQTALNQQAGLTTAMRNAGFDEAYKRGVGADTASANNQSTRLAGSSLAGQQSNAIRSANDAVGMFNTGQANTVGMFNTGQVNQARANNQSTRLAGTQSAAVQSNAIRSADDSMRMFQDQYAQNEATRVGNLAGQRAQTSLSTTNQIGSRNAQTYGDQAAAIDTQYGRNKDSIGLDSGYISDNYGADQDTAKMTGDVGDRAYNRAAGLTGSATGVATARANISGQDSEALINALKLGLGSSSKNAALSTLGGW